MDTISTIKETSYINFNNSITKIGALLGAFRVDLAALDQYDEGSNMKLFVLTCGLGVSCLIGAGIGYLIEKTLLDVRIVTEKEVQNHVQQG